MLAVLCEKSEPGTEVVAVEQLFAVPLIDQETGEVEMSAAVRAVTGRRGGASAPIPESSGRASAVLDPASRQR